MDGTGAERYLGTYCQLEPDDDPRQLWVEARAKLGEPFDNAGAPDIRDVPAAHTKYLNGVRNNPRFEDTVAPFDEWDFKLVEIDPLLAYQLHITQSRSDHLSSAQQRRDATMEELLDLCLPHKGDRIEMTNTSEGRNSITFETNTLNFRIMGTGHFKDEDDASLFVMGAQVGASTALVQIVSFNNPCYLTNGYHRLVGLRRRGVTHAPCIFGKTRRYGLTGAGQPEALARDLLEGDAAPT